LDPDHVIEQEHKKMKMTGGFVGIMGNEQAMEKHFSVAPIMNTIVHEFKDYCGIHDRDEIALHHESFGGRRCKLARNAMMLSKVLSRQGNPFGKQDLHNLMTFALSTPDVEHDIIHRDDLGKELLKTFVDERLVTLTVSVFGHHKRNNLRYFKDTGTKTVTKVAGQVVTLRQEQNLIARLLVVARSRPDLVPSTAIGEYEFHVCPPSNFSNDGCMLMLTNKHQLLSEIMKLCIDESAPRRVIISDIPVQQTVLIIDAMCIVQSLQVAKDIHFVLDFGKKFVEKVMAMATDYSEVRVLFDRYIEGSMKMMTR
jgi:hypothetical protein